MVEIKWRLLGIAILSATGVNRFEHCMIVVVEVGVLPETVSVYIKIKQINSLSGPN